VSKSADKRKGGAENLEARKDAPTFPDTPNVQALGRIVTGARTLIQK
jgi:hypothetical protein